VCPLERKTKRPGLGLSRGTFVDQPSPKCCSRRSIRVGWQTVNGTLVPGVARTCRRAPVRKAAVRTRRGGGHEVCVRGEPGPCCDGVATAAWAACGTPWFRTNECSVRHAGVLFAAPMQAITGNDSGVVGSPLQGKKQNPEPFAVRGRQPVQSTKPLSKASPHKSI
jgi:hypothetical protein